MKRIVLVISAVLALAGPAPWASVELVLHDGQVMRGADVRRDDDFYLLQLDAGGVLVFPIVLVREIRLAADGDDAEPVRRAPSGMRADGPEQLAGSPVKPPRTREQLEVLGKPSRFREGVIDPHWTPESDWSDDPSQNNFAPSTWSRSPIDPDWQPESAFDAGDDVLEGSRSAFRESIVDSTWEPEDAYAKKKKTSLNLAWAGVAGPRRDPGAGRDAAVKRLASGMPTVGAFVPPPVSATRNPAQEPPLARDADPAFCAAELFGSLDAATLSAAGGATPTVRPLFGEGSSRIPFELHVAALEMGGNVARAVFATTNGKCRLTGGNLELWAGRKLSDERRMGLAAGGYNDALADVGGVAVASARDKLDYVLAVASMIEADAGLVLMQDPEGDAPVAPPVVRPRALGDEATFFTWSARSGIVKRWEIAVGERGQIAVASERIATHVGDHADEPG